MRQIKNRTFASENGDRSAKRASGHSAESENVVFIVDLRNCGCDRPCNTCDCARGTAHRTRIRARGIGVNPYTAPSIVRIFQQLDELTPMPFEQLQREFPKVSPASCEQKGLIFGGLVADGFLIVEAERKSAVDNLGRVLMRAARGLGVADQVIRDSASLTELGHRGAWQAVRKELIATQADVEQAMIELRGQNGTFNQPRWLVARTGDQRGSNLIGLFSATGKDPGTRGFGRLLHGRIEDIADDGGAHSAV
jgi:hypothetical protein